MANYLNGRRRHVTDYDVYDNSWNERRHFRNGELEGGLYDSRDAKLTSLQRHLTELQEDNRLMSRRLSAAEGCLQQLDQDGEMLSRDPQLIDDYDPESRISRRDGSHRRHLRHELRGIRDDLDAMRDSMHRQDLDYGLDRGHSPGSRRRTMLRNGYGQDDGLGEWGARQLEGINYPSSPIRQRSADLYDVDGRRSPMLRGSRSPVRSGSTVGYRSVYPRPLVTQRNRFQSPISPRRFDVSAYGNASTFVPSSPADLCIGDRVKVSRHGGTYTSHGRVKYIGHLPGKVGPYVGLELESEGGKHDGMYNGYRYFQTKGYHGVFLPFDRILLAWRD